MSKKDDPDVVKGPQPLESLEPGATRKEVLKALRQVALSPKSKKASSTQNQK